MSDIRPNQRKAIEALAAGCTVEMAALQAGVSAKTVYQWKRDSEAFLSELQAASDSIMSEAVGMLIGASRGAIQTLTSIADDDTAPPATRVQAARSILENTIRLSELWELSRRIDTLETALAEQQNSRSDMSSFRWQATYRKTEPNGADHDQN